MVEVGVDRQQLQPVPDAEQGDEAVAGGDRDALPSQLGQSLAGRHEVPSLGFDVTQRLEEIRQGTALFGTSSLKKLELDHAAENGSIFVEKAEDGVAHGTLALAQKLDPRRGVDQDVSH